MVGEIFLLQKNRIIMLHKLNVFLFVFISSAITVYAQEISYQGVKMPSAEAAAIGKNVDIPMSYSAGTAQIGIPFYTVKSGSLSVPVSLSYNTAGIRVEE